MIGIGTYVLVKRGAITLTSDFSKYNLQIGVVGQTYHGSPVDQIMVQFKDNMCLWFQQEYLVVIGGKVYNSLMRRMYD